MTSEMWIGAVFAGVVIVVIIALLCEGLPDKEHRKYLAYWKKVNACKEHEWADEPLQVLGNSAQLICKLCGLTCITFGEGWSLHLPDRIVTFGEHGTDTPKHSEERERDDK